MNKILILFTFFALFTSTVFGDVIKTCSANYFIKDRNLYRWDTRSDKPYGVYVELALYISKQLNVELIILRRDTFNECFQLMRTGEIDFLLELIGSEEQKQHTKQYMELFEIVERKAGKAFVGLSKKSKFISKIDDFKNAIPRQKKYQKIIDRKYESIADNSWDTYRQKVCESPRRGTLTSALCFLVEKHSTVGKEPDFILDSVDEENCTFKVQGQTIDLNKVDIKNIKYKYADGYLCWIIEGENVSSGKYKLKRFAVCGRDIETSRLDKAFGAIYGKYCEGIDEEF